MSLPLPKGVFQVDVSIEEGFKYFRENVFELLPEEMIKLDSVEILIHKCFFDRYFSIVELNKIYSHSAKLIERTIKIYCNGNKSKKN